MFEHLENAMCEELDKLDEKYQSGQEISAGDLQKADLIFHALKSAATYSAMKGESGAYDGGSYARGRSRTTGRYISRDGSMRSGAYPREMIDPYWDRR